MQTSLKSKYDTSAFLRCRTNYNCSACLFLLSQSKLFNRNPPNCEFLWSWSHKFAMLTKLTATPLKMAIGLLFACKLSQQFSPMWPYFYAYFTVDAEVVWTIHSFIKITTTLSPLSPPFSSKHTRFSKQPLALRKATYQASLFVCDCGVSAS